VPGFIWQQFSVASAQVGYLYRTPLDAIPRNADRLNPVEAYQERVSTAHALEGQLQTAIQAVRQHAAGFLRDLDLDTIKLLLPDEATALVGFCLTNYGSLGFVVTQQSDRPVSIIEVRNFLAVHLHRLLFGLTGERDPIPGGWIMDITSVDDGRRCDALDRTLNEIGRRLLAPILTTVPTSVRRLIFLPSGGLFLLPLHAAPLMQSETERLCDRYEISYAPSVKVLATLQTGSISKTETGACMILNPENDPRLPFTACETQALLRRPEKGKRLLGRRARREAVLAAVRGCTYLHFAGHGSYHAEDPTNSGVQLADGRLTLADLWSGAADLSSARLVTLSACQTGLSDVRLGSAEEYVGLPAGFLLAGVPCVVASLWAVPDISTAILMDLFYTFHIQDQQSISAALRKAQACLRNATNSNVVDWLATQLQHADNPISALYSRYRYYRSQAKVAPDERPFHHPYYWAAFTVNGR
jgi:CHAT domain-containing protein